MRQTCVCLLCGRLPRRPLAMPGQAATVEAERKLGLSCCTPSAGRLGTSGTSISAGADRRCLSFPAPSLGGRAKKQLHTQG